MKLWLLSRDFGGYDYYDKYDSCVVASETEDDARTVNPSGNEYPWPHDAWVKPGQVQVKYIGEAAPGIERGVIVSSYNAG